ncbi:hypothetical protein DEO72_LG7g1642 [Vigna unguiculata]|uniref:Uncharacterized protein n=1 Tax=Vigna unguiculata TaxID=3917 RepID=A0A4D6MIF9_VIGUN|nr:hypothetical protein DEO72_LG7g1642 [Vigna unguiculata]
MLAFFQVREARVSSLDMNLCVGLREQWRKFDNLTQASGACLSKSIRTLSDAARVVAQATSSCFEREFISLRRGGIA